MGTLTRDRMNIDLWQLAIYPLSIFIFIAFAKLYLVLIFVIHTNFAWLFVIIKSEWPPRFLQNATTSRNDVVHVEEHETYNEDQDNDCMEEDDNDNIVQDDRTN